MRKAVTLFVLAVALLEGHLLDLYLPRGHHGALPLVICSQRSGWLAENGRSTAGMVAERFNPAGFAVAGVSVRSSANARFPGQVLDIHAANDPLSPESRLVGCPIQACPRTAQAANPVNYVGRR